MNFTPPLPFPACPVALRHFRNYTPDASPPSCPPQPPTAPSSFPPSRHDFEFIQTPNHVPPLPYQLRPPARPPPHLGLDTLMPKLKKKLYFHIFPHFLSLHPRLPCQRWASSTLHFTQSSLPSIPSSRATLCANSLVLINY